MFQQMALRVTVCLLLGMSSVVFYCAVDKFEKNEMGGACSSGEAYTGFWWGK
jgi:hypothetical protein